MKRFDIETYTRSFYEDSWEETSMRERETGKYCLFEDVKEIVQENETLKKELENIKKYIKDKYKNANEVFGLNLGKDITE